MIGRAVRRGLSGAYSLLATSLLVCGVAGGALAGDKLTLAGIYLGEVKVMPATAVVSRAVDLDSGEQPNATYVTMTLREGKRLQRTNEGYWVPWDGAVDSLVDNRFQPLGSQLVFKVLKEDLTGYMFPLTVTIAYRVPSGVKFGFFQVAPQ
jgi:hypothetical protein